MTNISSNNNAQPGDGDDQSNGEVPYNKTPVESIRELSVDDTIDIFYNGGWIAATVNDTDPPGMTKAVELISETAKLRINEHATDSQTLLEWRVGTEEDFADWRPKGDINTIKRVEKQQEQSRIEGERSNG